MKALLIGLVVIGNVACGSPARVGPVMSSPKMSATVAKASCTTETSSTCAARCEEGDAPSCYVLAGLHARGDRVGKDPKRAVELLERSCELGSAAAHRARA